MALLITMDTLDFGVNGLEIIGEECPLTSSNRPTNYNETPLSPNEADEPLLKFGSLNFLNTRQGSLHFLNTTRHLLNPLIKLSKSLNNLNHSSELILNEQFIDIELHNFVLRLQSMSSEKIRDTLITLSDGDFNLSSGALDSNNTLLHGVCSVPMGHRILVEVLRLDVMKLGINTNAENNQLELPIHIAIKHDHAYCVELLLNHDNSLLHVIYKDGFGIIHKASQHLSIASIQVIVKFDPTSVNTSPNHVAFKDASVIHIAIGSYCLKQSKKAQINQDKETEIINNDRKAICKISSFFLERCSRNMMVRNGRSVIHQMIEIEDIEGLKIVFRRFQKERNFIHDFVNSPDHETGRSALMTVIDKQCIDIAMLLLENGADPNARTEAMLDNRGQLVSERAVQLNLRPKDVAPLLSLLIKHGAEIIPALEAVIDVADITLARAIFDEIPDPKMYINHQHSTSGETILYSCLASRDLELSSGLVDTENQETENIFYLLEKGANVMKSKRLITYDNDGIDNSIYASDNKVENKLPIHRAVEIESAKKHCNTNYWGKNRARNYIDALKLYGIRKMFDQIDTHSCKLSSGRTCGLKCGLK